MAAKKKIKTRITLAGRKINDEMANYIIDELNNFLKDKNKSLKNSKIIIVGLTYKAGVADMRNSLNFEIFKKIKKINNNTLGYDPFVNKQIRITHNISDKINKNTKYDVILLLAHHEEFKKRLGKIILSKNKVLDPFKYYT